MPIGIGEVEKRKKRVDKKLHLDESRRSKNQIDVVEDKRLLNLTRFAPPRQIKSDWARLYPTRNREKVK